MRTQSRHCLREQAALQSYERLIFNSTNFSSQKANSAVPGFAFSWRYFSATSRSGPNPKITFVKSMFTRVDTLEPWATQNEAAVSKNIWTFISSFKLRFTFGTHKLDTGWMYGNLVLWTQVSTWYPAFERTFTLKMGPKVQLGAWSCFDLHAFTRLVTTQTFSRDKRISGMQEKNFCTSCWNCKQTPCTWFSTEMSAYCPSELSELLVSCMCFSLSKHHSQVPAVFAAKFTGTISNAFSESDTECFQHHRAFTNKASLPSHTVRSAFSESSPLSLDELG